MHSRDVFPGCFLYKTAASMQNRPVFAAPPERLRIRQKTAGPAKAGPAVFRLVSQSYRSSSA